MSLEYAEQFWSKCKRCAIGHYSFKHVYGEGSVPAKYLFVGEAPGVSEDILGSPFVGRSGRLLRDVLKHLNFRDDEVYITNLVACRPCDEQGGPNRTPSNLEIQNCEERLKGIVFMVQPKVVVAVGRIAAEELSERFSNFHIRSIKHPAYILRQGGKKGDNFAEWIDSIRKLKKTKEKK